MLYIFKKKYEDVFKEHVIAYRVNHQDSELLTSTKENELMLKKIK